MRWLVAVLAADEKIRSDQDTAYRTRKCTKACVQGREQVLKYPDRSELLTL